MKKKIKYYVVYKVVARYNLTTDKYFPYYLCSTQKQTLELAHKLEVEWHSIPDYRRRGKVYYVRTSIVLRSLRRVEAVCPSLPRPVLVKVMAFIP